MGPYRAGALADVATLDAPLMASGFRAGFRVQGLGFRVWGFGFKVRPRSANSQKEPKYCVQRALEAN